MSSRTTSAIRPWVALAWGVITAAVIALTAAASFSGNPDTAGLQGAMIDTENTLEVAKERDFSELCDTKLTVSIGSGEAKSTLKEIPAECHLSTKPTNQ